MAKKTIQFDWKAFKKYVDTYEPSKHGANDTQIIIKDMIYGIGLSVDKEKYKFHDGYLKFIEYLKEIFK